MQPFVRRGAQLLCWLGWRRNRWKNPAGPCFENRVITRNGLPNVIRLGDDHPPWRDLYHLLMTMPWSGFFAATFLLYVVGNGLFALLYLLDTNGIANAQPHSFWDAFFFSVQTMASLGYGAMHPTSFYTNMVVTVEALAGLLGLATITGMVFARVSRPTARVLFTDVATISVYDGVPTLMFRIRNLRRNQILEGQITVSLLLKEMSAEGHEMFRFHNLRLLRSQTPIFALTWTVMHAIDRSSPLYGLSRQDLEHLSGEAIATMTGLDETFSQVIHARHSYLPSEIFWNHRFVDIFSTRSDGRRIVNYQNFNSMYPIETSERIADNVSVGQSPSSVSPAPPQ
ncbi:MAG: ion channel [Cyanobacteria bacterium P01_A01_bin.3]